MRSLIEILGLKPSDKDKKLINAIKSANMQVLGRGTIRVEIKETTSPQRIADIQHKVKKLLQKQYAKSGA